ncbi:MAG: 2-hydroxyacyl-CoA dehydratase [Candidatus Lokiarchaeota archaeon]|nr:2-hydroxyacyl-CoA dehydratase [Candidatus Lokiarchaeota archaeon]
MAAGLAPVKILGDVKADNAPADQYLQNFLCPAARSMLTDALAHSGSWDGIVVAHGCDITHRGFDIWKKHVKTPFIHWLNVPMVYGTASAAAFFKKEMELLVRALEKQFAASITPDKLRAAIKESNEVKSRLQRLSALRATRDVPNRDYFDACVKAVTMAKNDAAKALDEAIKDWSARPAFPASMKKVLLTGSDITYPEFMDTLEEANIRAVRDDLSIGERYYATLIPEKDDPLDALVEYRFSIPRPATKNPPDPRTDFLLKAMEESGLDTVVSQNVKFCEPYLFDTVHIEKIMKAKGYKYIHLEREFSPVKDTQAINRLEAFIEMQGGAKA